MRQSDIDINTLNDIIYKNFSRTRDVIDMARHFPETVKGYKVDIEVWDEPGWNTRYNAYTDCPIEGCTSPRFKAQYRTTIGKARSDAKAALRKHLTNKHKIK